MDPEKENGEGASDEQMVPPNVPELARELRKPKASCEATLPDLHRALLKDLEYFKSGDSAGREGAVKALQHTITFLNILGIPNPAVEPLMALAAALNDLDAGIADPLLRPVSSGPGRAKTTINQQTTEAVIATIAEGHQTAAKEKGWSHITAMSRAARTINASGQFSNVDATRVKNIRTKVSGGNPADMATDLYRDFVQSPGFVEDPLGFAERLARDPTFGGNVI